MIDDSKEYIIAAAIWYDDGKKYNFQEVYGIRSGFVVAGFRHTYIYSIIPSNGNFPNGNDNLLSRNTSEYTTTQGFITSYGRFVSREEAREIAIKCGQCKKYEVGKLLYSEDVFKYQINYAD